MPHKRLLARLDIKAPYLIKGVHLEGLRKIGDPNEHARRYYEIGVDELLYMDAVASLYERNSLLDIIEYTTANIFIPFTVGGGLRTLQDIEAVLAAGADKIAINTAAVRNPNLIADAAKRFGSQCVVLSIEAKRKNTPNQWEAYTDNGREHTHLDVLDWAQQGADLGAGEILLTSVDQEGTRKGMDQNLIQAVADAVDIPVIASGGLGSAQHAIEAIQAGSDAVALADALHNQRLDFSELRQTLKSSGISLRTLPSENKTIGLAA